VHDAVRLVVTTLHLQGQRDPVGGRLVHLDPQGRKEPDALQFHVLHGVTLFPSRVRSL
jgi:hypothetical protein